MVSFGIFAFIPLGWLFMAFVILIECFTMTRVLTPKFFDKRVFVVATLANIVRGAIGILMSIAINGGWWLVVWFPWVCKHEVDLSSRGDWHGLIIYFAIAFLRSLVLEGGINIPLLRRRYAVKRMIKATLIPNILSYFVGSVILYSISFHTNVKSRVVGFIKFRGLGSYIASLGGNLIIVNVTQGKYQEVLPVTSLLLPF
jgi:hypothetical protein